MPRKSAEDDAYTGPFVTIRHDPPGWTVAVEPILPNGEGEPRKYPCKIQAFNEASRLWTAHRIGVIDFTNHNTGRTSTNKVTRISVPIESPPPNNLGGRRRYYVR